MLTTDKYSCQTIIDLMVSHGVQNVVISPGSRNAPLIVAASRNNNLNKTIVVDERSAAFVALGMCAAKNGETPVALICTSGSALLNYAPAISEAYYRCLPLIVISADRPIEWIDQDDSQTIRQIDALNNYVKKSYNIPSVCESDNLKWYVNRIVNDAIITAKSGRKSPVHINIQIDEPLNNLVKLSNLNQRKISAPIISSKINADYLSKYIFPKLQSKRILIIAGFQNCNATNWITKSDKSLIDSLNNFLCSHTNAVLLSESISNIDCELSIGNIDRVLSEMTAEEKDLLSPDIVISLGGAIVSRFVKQFLRENTYIEHWHIGLTNTTIDCFKSLTMRIDLTPSDFFNQLNELDTTNIKCDNTLNYRNEWFDIANRAEKSHNRYVSNCNWSDLKAFSIILPQLNGDLHLSNGTPIRYHQLFNYNHNINQVNCNRGVSGIDGSTSTAIGHSYISNRQTILISGDLSAQYDIGAFCLNNIPQSFKMIVMYNGGGGIFRFIKSTSELDELEDFFATKSKLPLQDISNGYGFNYFEAKSEQDLKETLPQFMNTNSAPSILAIYTPAIESAQILKNYFNRNN